MTQCPALETGCFAFTERNPEETHSTVKVMLKRLTLLTIEFIHPSIFDHFRFPVFRELSLSLGYFVETAPDYMFLQLATATKLATLGPQLSAHNIINLVRPTTNVTFLSIEFNILPSTNVFTALTPGSGSNKILLLKFDTIWIETSLTYGC